MNKAKQHAKKPNSLLSFATIVYIENNYLFFTWCIYPYIETSRADCFCDSRRTIAT